MSQDSVEIMRRARAAFNLRDAEAFGALLAPDAELIPLRAALEGTVYSGPGAVAKFFADMDESWESLSVEEDQIRDGKEWVLAIGRLRGRGRESGAEFDMRMAWVIRIRARQITSFRTYADPTDALEALGLMS